MRTALLISLAVHAGVVTTLVLLHFTRAAPEPGPVLSVSVRSDALAPVEATADEPPLRDAPQVEESWPVPEEAPAEPEIEAPAEVAGIGGVRMPAPIRLATPLARPGRLARIAPPPPPAVAAPAAPKVVARAAPLREPRLLPDSPPPRYPTRARQLGLEGTVILLLHIAADGTVASVEIASSSGYAILDRAAMDTAGKDWRFEPARRGTTAIEHDVRVPVEFKLTDA